MKVWWKCVLPNTNALHFCDIFFRHKAVFPVAKNFHVKIGYTKNYEAFFQISQALQYQNRTIYPRYIETYIPNNIITYYINSTLYKRAKKK